MRCSRFSEDSGIPKQEPGAVFRERRIHRALRKRAEEHRFPDPNKESTVFREDLPLPLVLYPPVGGSFFAFQETEGVEPVLCECSRYSLHMRIALLKRQADRLGIKYSLLYQSGVPDSVARRVKEPNSRSSEESLLAIRFALGLCHECNRVLPKLRYCVSMYGGPFAQVAGWYIQRCVSEWGVDFGSEPICILGDRCPEIVRQFAAERIPGAEVSYGEMVQKDWREANRIHLLVQKRTRAIMRVVENEIRGRFGFPPVGRVGGGELVVLQIVRCLFPNRRVLHRSRPSFLQGLEMDIFIPDLRLGIEVQGQQHFNPVAHWGGDSALNNLVERDRRKAALCETHGVKLLALDHDEPLDEGYLRVRIQDCLRNFNPLKKAKRDQ